LIKRPAPAPPVNVTEFVPLPEQPEQVNVPDVEKVVPALAFDRANPNTITDRMAGLSSFESIVFFLRTNESSWRHSGAGLGDV